MILQKKICMLGAFAVGKTSLVRRYVESIFSEAYLTTVGVKIDKRTLEVGNDVLNLILWDIAGDDDVSTVRMSYLRGAAGYFLVVDGTRSETLEVARSIHGRVVAELGSLPCLLLLNKHDLTEQWAFPPEDIEKLQGSGWIVRPTSARSGEGVEEAFRELAEKILG